MRKLPLLLIIVPSLLSGVATREPLVDEESQNGARPSFNADVEIARLSVAVLDGNGMPVGDLTREEFVVLEDGNAKQVSVFASPRDAPLDIAFLLDASSSVEDYAGDVVQAAQEMLSLLTPEDCVYFLPFPSDETPSRWKGAGNRSITNSLSRLHLGGSTEMYDALVRGVTALTIRRRSYGPSRSTTSEAVNASPAEADCDDPPIVDQTVGSVSRRQAVVLISDGDDTTSVYTMGDLLRALWEAQVPVFSVAVGETRNLGPYEFTVRTTPLSRRNRLSPFLQAAAIAQERNRHRLAEIARVSGGRLVLLPGPDLGKGLVESYAALLVQLRASYLIGYDSPGWSPQGSLSELKWRKIQVETTRPGLRVVSPDGYYPAPSATIRAREAVASALTSIQKGETEAALDPLDEAIATDPTLWEGYYYRGLVRGIRGQWRDARSDLEHALSLNPGITGAYEGIAEASLNLGDLPTAWENAIRAAQAGSKVGADQLTRLSRASESPGDLNDRLAAPRIFLGEPDLVDLLDNLLLDAILKRIRASVSDAPHLALVKHSSRADFIASVRVDKLVRGSQGALVGTLQVHAPGQSAILHQEKFTVPLEESQPQEHVLRELANRLEAWASQHR